MAPSDSIGVSVISLQRTTSQDCGRSKTKSEGDGSTFEEAITATEFGKFNWMLCFIAIPASFCSIFETTTMSYVFVAAQCDLDLSLNGKGLLNAITYSGMISSAIIWGFLFDTLGRKKLLIIGFMADAFFVFLSVLSQDLILLLISKFLGGFIINGPFAAMTSYLSEFHCARHRPKAQLVIGTFNSMGSVVLPLLAWAILPQNMDFTLFDTMKFHSWNVYLLICGLPSFISGVIFIFLPESPKFLMTCGQNEKALFVFKKVYSMNTGNPPESYPIKKLIDETIGGNVTKQRSKMQAIKEGFGQIKPLFLPPYLNKLILVCTIQLLVVMAVNMLRLWLPQIFQAIEDYNIYNNNTSASLCTMLETLNPTEIVNNTIEVTECVVNTDNAKAYINSAIVGSVGLIGYSIVGSLINCLGKKKMIMLLGTISGTSCLSLYFAQDQVTITALSSLYMSTSTISANVVLAVIVDMFPTTLRTLTLSLAMMVARAGAMTGNLFFPILLQAGCMLPFFVVGSLILASAVLSILLPNTDMKALE